MDELVFSREGKPQTITLKRGGRELTFRKAPDAFAVRLEHGRAANTAALEAALGQPAAEIRHFDSVIPERLEVFRITDEAELETTMEELRQAPNADVVTHVYTVDATPGGEIIPTGTMTIQFKPGVTKTQQEDILAEFGLAVVADLDFLTNGYTVKLTHASTENPLKIAAKLQQRAEIELAEPDLSVSASFEYRPADTLYQAQWHLENRGDLLGLKAGADVKAEAAWELTRGARSITICIIDDGFDLGHPDFTAPDKLVAPRDFGQNDLNPNPALKGENHGTACAGVALAEENGQGVVGLAPRCALMPIRMANVNISDNSIVDYFQYAIDHEADVISCSWSARPWDFPLSAKMSGIIHKAATAGRQGKGIVILFAAGNQARPLNGVKDGQISYQGFALHPDVLAVGASNSLDRRASYSNYGPELTLCAPSSGSPGRTVVTTDRRGAAGYMLGDYTDSFGGTSSATPLAAGLAALILSVNPELTAAEVRQIMLDTADKIDPEHGQYVNGHSPWYGYGRINAYQAVRRAQDTIERARPTEGSPSQAGLHLKITNIELALVEPSSPDVTRLLAAKTSFEMSGGNAATITANQYEYRTEVRLINLASGKTDLVATIAEALEPQTFHYVSRSQFALPEIGRYELRSRVVLPLPSGEIMAELPSSTILTINP